MPPKVNDQVGSIQLDLQPGEPTLSPLKAGEIVQAEIEAFDKDGSPLSEVEVLLSVQKTVPRADEVLPGPRGKLADQRVTTSGPDGNAYTTYKAPQKTGAEDFVVAAVRSSKSDCDQIARFAARAIVEDQN